MNRLLKLTFSTPQVYEMDEGLYELDGRFSVSHDLNGGNNNISKRQGISAQHLGYISGYISFFVLVVILWVGRCLMAWDAGRSSWKSFETNA